MARNRQRAKERKQRQQRDPDLGPVDDRIVDPALAGGAPPSDLGSVHTVDFDDDDEDAGVDPDDTGAHTDAAGRDVATPAPRKKGGIRVTAFVKACWAELQRVQWPDRKQVGQATAVVLGFVVIAGAFLGFADVVAQRIVNFIL
jgi:preprotein translocase subunit SecE